MLSTRVIAVIWDFDGTLADTLERNLVITRRIVERLLGGSAMRFRALRSRDHYAQAVHSAASWRELYVREFGVPLERTEDAAPPGHLALAPSPVIVLLSALKSAAQVMPSARRTTIADVPGMRPSCERM